MATINDNLYVRVHERMKERGFTEKEIKTVDEARGKLRTHTSIGAFAGATAAFLLGKSKNFKSFRLLLLTGSGLFFGSQTGYLAGALAGLSAINSLPNPQRVVSLMREVQMETVKGRQSSSPSDLPQKAQSPQAYFSPDMPDSQPNEHEAWGNIYPDADYNSQETAVNKQQSKDMKPQPAQQKSAWDKIREKNAPNSAWARIRLEAQHNSVDETSIAKARTERANRLRENTEFGQEELPRTREDQFEQRRIRKNQFGDLLE